MTNWYFESPHTRDRSTNRLMLAITAGSAVAALALAAANPQPKKQALPELTGNTQAVETACSQGHARLYGEKQTTVQGRQMRVNCDRYWSTQGQRMP